MYLLTDIKLAGLIEHRDETEIVQRYPSLLLVRTGLPPSDLPPGDYELIDDPSIKVHGVPVEIPEGLFELDGSPHTLVRFVGPVAPGWRAALEARGVKVLFWCPRFGACVRLPEGMDADALRQAFLFVAGARPYRQEQCSRDLPEQTTPVRARAGVPESVLDLVCFSREERAGVEKELRDRGVKILATSSSKVRVSYAGDPAVLRDIVGVKVVDAARGVVPLAETTTQAVLGLAAQDGRWQSAYDGRRQVIAVADTGLDRGLNGADLHPDFSGRVRHISSWPINTSWESFVQRPGANDNAADLNTGHGTHVAGLAVGSGALSGGIHRGVAPQAELVFQALEQYTEIKHSFASQMKSGYYLSGRPLDLRQLFQKSHDLGARIHVNAWGDPAQGHYTNDSYETDLFLQTHPDAVILFAAGNDGADRDGDGDPDQRTLYAPASAKNVVAVGATSGALRGVGLRGTWGDLDPQQKTFRGEARRVPISGEPESVALCSSAGPTADGRVKPDVCAPGTNMIAPRSSATRQQGWGFASPMPYYMYYGGTSMATGVAGGFVANLRQAWEEHMGGAAPSGAALKALVIMGAKPVLRRSGAREESRTVAGFGRLYFPHCLPVQEGRAVTLVDETEVGMMTGEARAHAVAARLPGAFRAVLTWYDAPGETLVNDLDLCLVNSRGEKIWGNHPGGGAGTPDRVNNVEVIDIPELDPGDYELRVIAANVPAAPQSFALAFTNASASSTSSNGQPQATRRLEVALDLLRGVGKATAERLAGRGLNTVGALARLSEPQLGEALGRGGALLTRLRARLVLLERATAQKPPASVAPETTLADLFAGQPPTAAPREAWDAARLALLPISLAFKSQHLVHITLQNLFG